MYYVNYNCLRKQLTLVCITCFEPVDRNLNDVIHVPALVRGEFFLTYPPSFPLPHFPSLIPPPSFPSLQMPLTTGHQKVQTNIMKGFQRPQQYIHQHCQLGHVSPSLSLLVSVCVLLLPMLGLVDDHVQLTTTCHISPIHQCYIHSHHMTFSSSSLVLILPSLDSGLLLPGLWSQPHPLSIQYYHPLPL